MKRCNKCREFKPISEFHAHKQGKFGVTTKCKVCCAAYHAAYYQANRKNVDRDKANAATKRHRQTVNGRAAQLLASARKRAKERGLDFDLTIEQVRLLLFGGVCQKSGIPFSLESNDGKWRNPFAPSLDRIEADKGYIANNVQLVCNLFNMGKSDQPELDFIAMCLAVAARNQNNNDAIARLNELLNARL